MTQTYVGRFLSSPQRVDVGMIGGQAGRHLGTLGNGAVAGDQDIDAPGGLTQPVERRLVGAHLIGNCCAAARAIHDLRLNEKIYRTKTLNSMAKDAKTSGKARR